MKKEKKNVGRLAKKFLAVGKIYDTATVTDQEIQDTVQKDLDNLAGGHVRFQIQQVSDKELELAFYRNYIYTSNRNDEIFSVDADVITGRGLPGFVLPEMWFRPPFGYDFYFPITEFLRCYKKSGRILKANRAKDIQLDIQPTKIVMKLTY